MKLPPHTGLTIEHNPHVAYVETVEEHAARQGLSWPGPNDRDQAIASGELWVLYWEIMHEMEARVGFATFDALAEYAALMHEPAPAVLSEG